MIIVRIGNGDMKKIHVLQTRKSPVECDDGL
jgi:hypothetical protein